MDTVVTIEQVVHTVEVPGEPSVLVVVDERVQVVTAGLQGPQGPAGTADVSPINFSFGDPAQRVVLTTTTNQVISAVSVFVATAFDGAASTFALGTAAQPELLVAAQRVDLGIATEFEVDPNVVLPANSDIVLTLGVGFGVTRGAGWITVHRTNS
jgi:hypothetical protein